MTWAISDGSSRLMRSTSRAGMAYGSAPSFATATLPVAEDRASPDLAVDPPLPFRGAQAGRRGRSGRREAVLGTHLHRDREPELLQPGLEERDGEKPRALGPAPVAAGERPVVKRQFSVLACPAFELRPQVQALQ